MNLSLEAARRASSNRGGVNRSSMLAALRLAVGVALLAVVFDHAGGREIVARLRSIDPALFLAAFALLLLGEYFHALRWRWLLVVAVPTAPRVAHLFSLVMVGTFFNFLMPSTVGGDVVRAEMLRNDVGGRTHAYFSILVGRVLGLSAIVAIAALAMGGSYLITGWWDGQIVAVTACIAVPFAALCVWVLRGSLPPRWTSWLPQRVRDAIARGREALGAYAAFPAVLWGVFGFAMLANVISTVGVVWVLAISLGIEVPLYFHFVAVPLIVLVTLIPISFNGIGLREGAFAYVYAKAAVGTGAAVSLSLSFTAILALCSLLGGLFLLVPRRGPRGPR